MSSTSTRTSTIEFEEDGNKHRLVVEYGIRTGIVQPYFFVTGELYVRELSKRYPAEPEMSGRIHDIIVERMPWLRQLVTMHLCDAETGQPLYAEANGWYWYTSHKTGVPSMPHSYRALDPTQRAATYLGCDPSLFADEIATPQDFAAVIDTLRPIWAQRAEVTKALYNLAEPTAGTS